MCPCPKIFLEPFDDATLLKLKESTATAEGFIYDDVDVEDDEDYEDYVEDVDDVDDVDDKDYVEDVDDEDSSSSSEGEDDGEGEGFSPYAKRKSNAKKRRKPNAKKRKSTTNLDRGRKPTSNHSWD